jgi:hypothetical protein
MPPTAMPPATAVPTPTTAVPAAATAVPTATTAVPLGTRIRGSKSQRCRDSRKPEQGWKGAHRSYS